MVTIGYNGFNQAMEEEDVASKPADETQTIKKKNCARRLEQRKSTIIHQAPVANKATIGYDGSDQAMGAAEKEKVTKHKQTNLPKQLKLPFDTMNPISSA